jgi:RNA-directed DNA polymerase
MAYWFLEVYKKACFDRSCHDWLLANIPTEKTILRKWLKAGFMEQGILHPTDEGTPQGGIISPVLANMTLDGLEERLKAQFHTTLRARSQNKVNFVRYADDFIITGSSKELLKSEVLPLVQSFMKERGLELSPEKTRITHIEDGFDFLGQNVRKYDGVLLIKPSKKSIKSLLGKVREIIKANKTATAGNLILQLTPIIRGWANYHRHVCSKRTFSYVDHEIFKALWQWAVRRHSNKGLRWIKDKYFKVVGGQKWVFTGEFRSEGGKPKIIRLFSAARTPIRRHGKIRGEANPYDPAWEMYFERRLDVKMENNLRDKYKLLNLWRSQNGICPVCEQKITEITSWHSHHIVWRSKGGSDNAKNQVLVHPNCHMQIHSQGISVMKPRPERA